MTEQQQPTDQQQQFSNYYSLQHLATFSMLITDDGAIAISALSRVYFEENLLVVELLSGEKVRLGETSTQQFLDQTSQVAQGIQKQASSKLIDPRKYSRH